MSNKRREKAYHRIALNCQRSFSFGKDLSICVILKDGQHNFSELKRIVNSLATQTYTSFCVLFLADKTLNKQCYRLLKKLPTLIICTKSELKEVLRNGYDIIISSLLAPIPEDEFFRIYQAAALHPSANAFLSENGVCDAYEANYYISSITENKSLNSSENICYTGKRPTPFQRGYTPKKNSTICAGMVLFNPDIDRTSRNVENTLTQVDHLFIVDNGSSNIADFSAKFSNDKRVTFILNGENKGIAFALNRILHAASENGYEWVLTLDNDTICDKDMIAVYSEYIHLEKVGIISPYIIHRGSLLPEEYLSSPKYEADLIHTYDRCITSASLTNVKAATEIGGFNDELFIDAVDFDFNHRLLSAGYSILKANDTYIVQEIGNRTPIKLFNLIYKVTRISKFKTVRYFSVHSDFRLYYIARNYKWFLRKYNVTSPTVNRWANFKDMVLRFMLYPKSRSRIKMFKTVRKGHRDSKKMTY